MFFRVILFVWDLGAEIIIGFLSPTLTLCNFTGDQMPPFTIRQIVSRCTVFMKNGGTSNAEPKTYCVSR